MTLPRLRGTGEREVVASIERSQQVRIALYSLNLLRPCLLAWVFSKALIVVRLYRRPINQDGKNVDKLIRIHSKVFGELRDFDAAGTRDGGKNLGGAYACRAIHAANAVVSPKENGSDTNLRTARSTLVRKLVATRHAEKELCYAHVESPGGKKMPSLMKEHEYREKEYPPKGCRGKR